MFKISYSRQKKTLSKLQSSHVRYSLYKLDGQYFKHYDEKKI